MTRDQIHELAAEIAEHLDGFDVESPPAEPMPGTYLAAADGRRLFVRQAAWNRPDAVSITGEYPGTYRDYPRDAPKPITASVKRGGQAIARDIERRYLPAYTVAHAAAVERQEAAAVAAGNRNGTLARLAAVLGVAVPESGRYNNPGDHREGRLRWSNSGGTIDAYQYGSFNPGHDGARVDVELHSLPAATAEKIAALLVAEVTA